MNDEDRRLVQGVERAIERDDFASLDGWLRVGYARQGVDAVRRVPAGVDESRAHFAGWRHPETDETIFDLLLKHGQSEFRQSLLHEACRKPGLEEQLVLPFFSGFKLGWLRFKLWVARLFGYTEQYHLHRSQDAFKLADRVKQILTGEDTEYQAAELSEAQRRLMPVTDGGPDLAEVEEAPDLGDFLRKVVEGMTGAVDHHDRTQLLPSMLVEEAGLHESLSVADNEEVIAKNPRLQALLIRDRRLFPDGRIPSAPEEVIFRALGMPQDETAADGEQAALRERLIALVRGFATALLSRGQLSEDEIESFVGEFNQLMESVVQDQEDQDQEDEEQDQAVQDQKDQDQEGEERDIQELTNALKAQFGEPLDLEDIFRGRVAAARADGQDQDRQTQGQMSGRQIGPLSVHESIGQRFSRPAPAMKPLAAPQEGDATRPGLAPALELEHVVDLQQVEQVDRAQALTAEVDASVALSSGAEQLLSDDSACQDFAFAQQAMINSIVSTGDRQGGLTQLLLNTPWSCRGTTYLAYEPTPRLQRWVDGQRTIWDNPWIDALCQELQAVHPGMPVRVSSNMLWTRPKDKQQTERDVANYRDRELSLREHLPEFVTITKKPGEIRVTYRLEEDERAPEDRFPSPWARTATVFTYQETATDRWLRSLRQEMRDEYGEDCTLQVSEAALNVLINANDRVDGSRRGLLFTLPLGFFIVRDEDQTNTFALKFSLRYREHQLEGTRNGFAGLLEDPWLDGQERGMPHSLESDRAGFRGETEGRYHLPEALGMSVADILRPHLPDREDKSYWSYKHLESLNAAVEKQGLNLSPRVRQQLSEIDAFYQKRKEERDSYHRHPGEGCDCHYYGNLQHIVESTEYSVEEKREIVAELTNVYHALHLLDDPRFEDSKKYRNLHDASGIITEKRDWQYNRLDSFWEGIRHRPFDDEKFDSVFRSYLARIPSLTDTEFTFLIRTMIEAGGVDRLEGDSYFRSPVIVPMSIREIFQRFFFFIDYTRSHSVQLEQFLSLDHHYFDEANGLDVLFPLIENASYAEDPTQYDHLVDMPKNFALSQRLLRNGYRFVHRYMGLGGYAPGHQDSEATKQELSLAQDLDRMGWSASGEVTPELMARSDPTRCYFGYARGRAVYLRFMATNTRVSLTASLRKWNELVGNPRSLPAAITPQQWQAVYAFANANRVDQMARAEDGPESEGAGAIIGAETLLDDELKVRLYAKEEIDALMERLGLDPEHEDRLRAELRELDNYAPKYGGMSGKVLQAEVALIRPGQEETDEASEEGVGGEFKSGDDERSETEQPAAGVDRDLEADDAKPAAPRRKGRGLGLLRKAYSRFSRKKGSSQEEADEAFEEVVDGEFKGDDDEQSETEQPAAGVDRDLEAGDTKPAAPRSTAERLAFLREVYSRLSGGKWLRLEQAAAVLMAYENNALLQQDTGEGKTLTIQLVALLHVLDGRKVDVLTHNAPLAREAAEQLARVATALGINVAHRDDGVAGQDIDIFYTDVARAVIDRMMRRYRGDEDVREAEVGLFDEADNEFLDMASQTVMRIASGEGLRVSEEDFYTFLCQMIELALEEGDDPTPEALATRFDGDEFCRAEQLTGEQLQRWYESAQRAMTRRKDTDYVVLDEEESDGDECQVHRRVRIVHKDTTGRVDMQSQWSDGVHQLVAARERQLESEQERPGVETGVPQVEITPVSHVILEGDIPSHARTYAYRSAFSGTIGDADSRAQLQEQLQTDVTLVLPRARRDLDPKEVVELPEDELAGIVLTEEDQVGQGANEEVTETETVDSSTTSGSGEEAAIVDGPRGKEARQAEKAKAQYWPRVVVEQEQPHEDLLADQAEGEGPKVSQTAMTTLRHNRRYDFTPKVYVLQEEYFENILTAVRSAREKNLSTLLFLNTIEECNQFFEWLVDNGVDASQIQIYDDTHDETGRRPPESMLVSQAGQRGRVTLATAAGGRGTDFKDVDVAILAKPGLKRIEDQMAGRVGRDGQRAITEKIFWSGDFGGQVEVAAGVELTGSDDEPGGYVQKPDAQCLPDQLRAWQEAREQLTLSRLQRRATVHGVRAKVQSDYLTARAGMKGAGLTDFDARWKQYIALAELIPCSTDEELGAYEEKVHAALSICFPDGEWWEGDPGPGQASVVG